MSTLNKKKAMYAGSFDPFTNGHLYILKEASMLFDEVTVCIAKNENKKRSFCSSDEMKERILKVIKNNNLNNVNVIVYDGLIAKKCEEENIRYLIRGIRDTSDYLYEERIARTNFEINKDLKTIYFRAENDAISSSLVRVLYDNKMSIDQYVPNEILN